MGGRAEGEKNPRGSATGAGARTPAAALPGHWIVGLSQDDSSRGALIFAAWLADQAAEGARPEFTVVEVLDEALLMDRLRFEDRDELIAEHRRRSDALLTELEVADSLGRAHISVGWKVEDELKRRLDEFEDGGLLVGRRAGTEGLHLVKLGKLARHMVRNPPAPMLVVPPDLKAEDIGPGPVVVLVDGRQDEDRACPAALEMGQALGRPVRLVRSEETQTADGQQTATGSTADCQVMTAPDSSADTLLEAADRAEAVVVVTVSHRLGLGERILEGDLGSRLAAQAARPVLVLGPKPDERSG